MSGRPGLGVEHVDRLAGDAEAKRRLRVILQTLNRELSVEQACRELGVGHTRFHELRAQALQGALEGLAPRRTGRPPSRVEATDSPLQRVVDELSHELKTARVREELLLALPRVVFDSGLRGAAGEKGGAAKPRARPSPGNDG